MVTVSDEERDAMLEQLTQAHQPEEVKDTFGELPDSIYRTRLDSIYLDKIKDKIKIIIKFEITDGSYANRIITKFCNMETIQNLDFLSVDLKRLGFPNNFQWKDLETYFPMVLDRIYEVALVTNNQGYQNIYLRKEILLESSKSAKEPQSQTPSQPSVSTTQKQKSIFDEPKSSPTITDDDIPF